MDDYRLGQWLSHFAQAVRQRVNERLLVLGEADTASSIERVQILYQTQYSLVVGIEASLRKKVDKLLPGFISTHPSLESACQQNLAILGVDSLALRRQSACTTCRGDWESLGLLYAFECVHRKTSRIVNEWVSDCSLPEQIMSQLKQSEPNRWGDLNGALSDLEAAGINRAQFDQCLEGMLNGYEQWEKLLESTLEGFGSSVDKSVRLEVINT